MSVLAKVRRPSTAVLVAAVMTAGSTVALALWTRWVSASYFNRIGGSHFQPTAREVLDGTNL